MTVQVSWRADEELIERARQRARSLDRSLNSYISLVIDTATNPDAAGNEAERLRERLDAAGLLVTNPSPEHLPPTTDELTDAMAALRASEQNGQTLAELINEDRGG